MRKRLYNEYAAAVGDDVTDIERIMQDASNEVLKYCDDNNLDLRDANTICKNMIDIMFSDHILKEAFKMKKRERESKKVHINPQSYEFIQRIIEDYYK
jgi:hypothetical protein